MKRALVPVIQRCARRRSYLCSAVRFVSSHAPPAQDDFVDLGFLSEMGTGPSSLASSAATTNAGSEPVLGVVRAHVDPEGTEYSRFKIPLDAPRGGKPIPRENSRALLSPWEEEALMLAALDGRAAESSTGEASRSSSAPAKAAAEELQHEQRESSALVASSSVPLPNPSSLPYDDEKFADMILEMEVEGAIDDAWQDSRKAHIEDVKEVVDILKSLKVRDICCIDVSAKTGNFDYMMFGTCEGARHIHLAAWAAQEADSLRRVSKIKRKQTDELWEVVPIGRIVLNLMVESQRDQLTLERKWAVTASMDPLATANAPVSEGRQVRAHGLWTLTLNLQDLEDFEVDYCKDILLRQ